MEKADFCEFYSAMVTCPHCGKDIELDIGSSRYCEGDEIDCPHCEGEFELGESLS